MNYSTVMYICVLCVGIKCDNGDHYTDEDFSAIRILSEYSHSSSVIFVENAGDVSLFRRCQEHLGIGFYYSSFNSSVLKMILGNDTLQDNFFHTRSVVVTKEQLNLTELLDQVLHPHYLTWIILRRQASEASYIPASCNVLFVNTTEGVTVEQVYHPKRGFKAVKTLWSLEPKPGRKLSTETFRPQQENINFRNVSLDLHVLYVQDVCQEKGGTIMKKLNCIHQDLLTLIGARLNYSVNFVECLEKEYPYAFPNGTDSELFVKLKNREVDFSAASHVVRRVQRRPFMDYVWPTFVLKSMMYLKQARLTSRWASYLRPLEASVWWCILACITIIGVLMKIFEKSLANNFKLDSLFVYEVIMSTFRALQVFCNQAVVDLSTSYSIRIIYFLKFFVVLIFFQAYCGYLVSSLTVVVSRFPFTDLNGFLENQQYRIMTLRRGFHRYYFRKVVLDGYDENLMLPDEVLPNTIQEAVDKLCDEDYLAFTEFREDLLNFGALSCKISELPSPLVHLYVGIGIPKKTPLKEYLKRELLHLHSTGIIQRMGSYLSAHSDFRDSSASGEYSRVSITHVFSIFILLHVGIGVSLVIFCVEVIVKKIMRSSVVEKRIRKCNRSRMVSGILQASSCLKTSG